jgi:hypothetical protein
MSTRPSVEAKQVNVRRVTEVQASWTEADAPDQPGAFTVQLILSNGADYYVLQPTADDAKVQLKQLKKAPVTIFDKDRQVLIPRNVR